MQNSAQSPSNEPWPDLYSPRDYYNVDGFDTPRTSIKSYPEESGLPMPNATPPLKKNSVRLTSRGPSAQFRTEKEREHASLTSAGLLNALINAEYEVRQTQKVFKTAYGRLREQTERANDNENRALDSAQGLRALLEEKRTLQRELDLTQEQLRGYKSQLANAQQEILRANEIVKGVEADLAIAEEDAAQARSKNRQLIEERNLQNAMDEGRRLGYEEGMKRGRMRGFDDGRQLGWNEHRRHVKQLYGKRAPSEATYEEDPYFESGQRIHDDPRERYRDQYIEGAPEPVRQAPPPPLPPAHSSDDHHRHRSHDRPRASSRARPPPVDKVLPSKPMSVTGSPRPPSTVHQLPPEGFIPTMSADGIHLPAAFELKEVPDGSVFSSSANIARATSPPSASTAGPSRPQVVTTQDAPKKSRRKNSGDSQMSELATELDDLLSTHNTPHRDGHPGNLSTIMEMSDSGRSVRSPEVDRPKSAISEAFDRQIMADQLRYSDPEQAEDWRRIKAAQAASVVPQTPRKMPAVVTTPAPLDPSHLRADQAQFSQQPPSPTAMRPLSRRRYSGTSDSPVQITVEPPSRTVSGNTIPKSQGQNLNPHAQVTPMHHQQVSTQPNTPETGQTRLPHSNAPAQSSPLRTNVPHLMEKDVYRTDFSSPYMPTVGGNDHYAASPSAASHTSRNLPPASPSRSTFNPPNGNFSSSTPNRSYPPLPPPDPAMVYPTLPQHSGPPAFPSFPQSSAPVYPAESSKNVLTDQPPLGHKRSASLNIGGAGSTPGPGRPLTLSAKGSRSSLHSDVSANGRAHHHFDKNDYLDPAFLAAANDKGKGRAS